MNVQTSFLNQLSHFVGRTEPARPMSEMKHASMLAEDIFCAANAISASEFGSCSQIEAQDHVLTIDE